MILTLVIRKRNVNKVFFFCFAKLKSFVNALSVESVLIEIYDVYLVLDLNDFHFSMHL